MRGTLGVRGGLRVVGTPGMSACAAWLRALITEVPVEAIAAGDPYWRPR